MWPRRRGTNGLEVDVFARSGSRSRDVAAAGCGRVLVAAGRGRVLVAAGISEITLRPCGRV